MFVKSEWISKPKFIKHWPGLVSKITSPCNDLDLERFGQVWRPLPREFRQLFSFTIFRPSFVTDSWFCWLSELPSEALNWRRDLFTATRASEIMQFPWNRVQTAVIMRDCTNARGKVARSNPFEVLSKARQMIAPGRQLPRVIWRTRRKYLWSSWIGTKHRH